MLLRTVDVAETMGRGKSRLLVEEEILSHFEETEAVVSSELYIYLRHQDCAHGDALFGMNVHGLRSW